MACIEWELDSLGLTGFFWVILAAWETHIRQEGGVAADATQADKELQSRFQVVVPLVVADHGRPGVLHLWAGHIIPILAERVRGDYRC